MDTITNKVSESGLITLNIEDFIPREHEIVIIDLKEILFEGFVLKEKELREYLKNLPSDFYQNKWVGVTCTADALIPTWAYMLVAVTVCGLAKGVFFYRNKQQFIEEVVKYNLNKINLSDYEDKRVVVKGCGNKIITENIYTYIVLLLKPRVKSLMYGEPCSTVPLYKKKINGASLA